MAKYIPIRPRHNPRGEVVNYVCNGHLCARSWPKEYHDANTPAQQLQRGKMAQVCRALPYVKNLLAMGYSSVVKRNGRHVGSYHAAVSTALREWFDKTTLGDAFNASKIQLTDGVHPLPSGFSATRRNLSLLLAWQAAKETPWTYMLFAARCDSVAQWISQPIELGKNTNQVAVTLPTEWGPHPVEVWVAFVILKSPSKTTTHYQEIMPST